jgi:hypothetical protein
MTKPVVTSHTDIIGLIERDLMSKVCPAAPNRAQTRQRWLHPRADDT